MAVAVPHRIERHVPPLPLTTTHLVEALAFEPAALKLAGALLELVEVGDPLADEADDLQRLVDLLVATELVLDVGVAERAHVGGQELAVAAQQAAVQRQRRDERGGDEAEVVIARRNGRGEAACRGGDEA